MNACCTGKPVSRFVTCPWMTPVSVADLPKSTRIAAPQKTVTVCCCGRKPGAEAATTTPCGELLVPTVTDRNEKAPVLSVSIEKNCFGELMLTFAPAIDAPVSALTTVPEIVAPVQTLMTSTSTVAVWLAVSNPEADPG